MQRGAHSRSLCEAYAVDILETGARLRHCVPDYRQHPVSVMLSSVSGEKALSGWCDVRMPDVRQNRGRAVRCMLDDPGAELVRRALKPEGDIVLFCSVSLEGLANMTRFTDQELLMGIFEGELA